MPKSGRIISRALSSALLRSSSYPSPSLLRLSPCPPPSCRRRPLACQCSPGLKSTCMVDSMQHPNQAQRYRRANIIARLSRRSFSSCSSSPLCHSFSFLRYISPIVYSIHGLFYFAKFRACRFLPRPLQIILPLVLQRVPPLCSHTRFLLFGESRSMVTFNMVA